MKEVDVYRNVCSGTLVGKIYDNWLTTSYLNYGFRDYNSFHPSDIATCNKKAYLMSIKKEGHFNIIPKQQRTFENGHSTHARYQEHLGEIGILRGLWKCYNCEEVIGKENPHGVTKPSDCPFCNNPKKSNIVRDDEDNILCGARTLFEYVELPVHDEELDIHGHTDGIIDIQGKKFIIDFKTCSVSVFSNIIDSNLPLKSHIRQVNFYMYILNVDYACIFYENKNTMETKEFYLKKDDEIINDLIAKTKECLEARITGVEPDIPKDLQEENLALDMRSRYEKLSPYCKGFYGFPPCPFFYYCHSSVFEAMGGEELYKYKDAEGNFRKYIKINKQVTERD